MRRSRAVASSREVKDDTKGRRDFQNKTLG